MTESKTFKNIAWVSGDGNAQSEWIVSDGPRSVFSREEWDMEVTFTRKPPQPKAGNRVDLHGATPGDNLGTVVGVDGQDVWVKWDESSVPEGMIYNASQLYVVG